MAVYPFVLCLWGIGERKKGRERPWKKGHDIWSQKVYRSSYGAPSTTEPRRSPLRTPDDNERAVRPTWHTQWKATVIIAPASSRKSQRSRVQSHYGINCNQGKLKRYSFIWSPRENGGLWLYKHHYVRGFNRDGGCVQLGIHVQIGSNYRRR